MIKAKPFKLTQKFRVSVSNTHGVSFFATKKQILAGVGESSNFNDALRHILEKYEACNITDPKVTGFLGDSLGFIIQLDQR